MKEKDSLKFEEMTKEINKYLNIEKISINLNGYKDTVLKYFKLNDNDIDEAYILMIECNLWSNYISEIEKLIEYYLLASQLTLDKFNATYDRKLKDEKTDKIYEVLSKRCKDFKLFLRQISVQRNFFEKAFWHCYQIYVKSSQLYINYGNID